MSKSEILVNGHILFCVENKFVWLVSLFNYSNIANSFVTVWSCC